MKIRPTYIWIVLLAITLISWIGVYGVKGLISPKALALTLLALAVIKTRFVMLDFMELRDAPRLYRLSAEGWCLAIYALLAGLYLFG